MGNLAELYRKYIGMMPIPKGGVYMPPEETNIVDRVMFEDQELPTPTLKRSEDKTNSIVIDIPSFDEEEITEDDFDRILDAQIMRESGGNPNAVGKAGEMGAAQFMPATWQMAIDRGWVEEKANPFDIKQARIAQRKFMEHLMGLSVFEGESYEERLEKALASYNWGIGNVIGAMEESIDKYGTDDNWKEFVYGPTQNYIKDIFKRARLYKI